MNKNKDFFMVGERFEPSAFRFFEGDSFNPQEIVHVLLGNSLGCIFRNVVPAYDCQRIANHFWQHPLLSKRTDGVPAYNLGTYHYNKSLKTYLDEAEKEAEELSKIFLGVRNYFNEMIDSLKIYLQTMDLEFRVAKHDGRPANQFNLRSCQSDSEYVIAPHDDLAQCQVEAQRGFEIQQVVNYHINAFNLCLENNNQGELQVWNIQPDVQTKKRLGIENTGYPYSQQLLEPIQRVNLSISPGDIYCLNTRFIHAVKSPPLAQGFRTTLSFFMGQIDPKTVIYWT